MLTVQYRMHPLIRYLPSKHFYDNQITDGENIRARSLPAEIVPLASHFRRCVFFDLPNTQESVESRSKCNYDECEFTLTLIKTICAICGVKQGLGQLAGKIAVITPYKAQVNLLKNGLQAWIRSQGLKFNSEVEVNTVDAFQGREKDIVIFNCVRSNKLQTMQGSLGFLTDERRLNVAITRPRHFLFYVGSSETLVKAKVWKGMIQACQEAQRQGGYFRLEHNIGTYNPGVLKQIIATVDASEREKELVEANKLGLDPTQIKVHEMLKLVNNEITPTTFAIAANSLSNELKRQKLH